MKTLETIIYVLFFITMLRITMGIFIIIINHQKTGRTGSLRFSVFDNVIWLAPTIYFTGGL